MRDRTAPNKWLLVQLGKDDHYWTHTFSSRRTAEREDERDLNHEVPFVVVELDKLMNPLAPPEDDAVVSKG